LLLARYFLKPQAGAAAHSGDPGRFLTHRELLVLFLNRTFVAVAVKK
jgi:hypothetical protein